MATTTRTTKTTRKTATTTAKPAVKKAPAVKKPAAKKPVSPPLAKTVAAKKPAVKATTTTTDKAAKSAPKRVKATPIPDEQRRHMIATAAYYLATQRGFSGDCEMQDWFAAEMQIEAQLNSKN